MFTTRIAVSFWTENIIALYSFQGNKLQPLAQSELLPSLPRSVLLHNFGPGRKPKDAEYRPHVLAGLTNGSIVSFNFKDNKFQDKKIFSVGELPVQLSPCEIDGRKSVFASGATSAIVYWDKQSVRYSPVLVKDVVTTARLNTPTFSSSHIFATASTIIVGRVKGVDKMQVRQVCCASSLVTFHIHLVFEKQIPFGRKNPRRLAYHKLLKEFGIAFRHVTPARIGESELPRNTFSLFDAHTFNRAYARSLHLITSISHSS